MTINGTFLGLKPLGLLEEKVLPKDVKKASKKLKRDRSPTREANTKGPDKPTRLERCCTQLVKMLDFSGKMKDGLTFLQTFELKRLTLERRGISTGYGPYVEPIAPNSMALKNPR